MICYSSFITIDTTFGRFGELLILGDILFGDVFLGYFFLGEVFRLCVFFVIYSTFFS